MNKAQRAKKRDARFLALKKQGFRMFVASKTGTNALGRGASRSVVLSSMDGKKWVQHAKFWGRFNEQEATNYVQWFKNLKEAPLNNI